jgi:phosphoglycerol transferase MdoB-like AlkP superfamily enzyme
VKAYYLGVPALVALSYHLDYLRSLAAISYVDVLFAAGAWASARVLLAFAGEGSLAAAAVVSLFLAFSAAASLYAVANVIMFGIFGGFLTYPLLALIGSVRMLSSSIWAHLTPRVALALIALPATHLAMVEATVRLLPARAPRWKRREGVAFLSLGVWILLGQYAFSTVWATRQDRKIAQNPHWVLLSSWWHSGDGAVRMTDRFPPEDLRDFDPLGAQPPSTASIIRRIARPAGERLARRPPNVIVLVLESVAARWASLNGGVYESTPSLRAESSQALVFDNFYAHIGRSSNSLAAILMSVYPRLDFRDLTDQYPRMPGTSLAAVFRDRGYRTAFITPSDLAWAGWDKFLSGRGFSELRDFHALPCSGMISSWGVEDRCMVDGMIAFIDRNRSNPFFLMGWTTQTHHPYEPTPGVPLIDMEREPVPDQWELGRYLNVLHETDRHLSRLFEAIRAGGLDHDTLVVVVGDHGQAFGYPHNSYIQGRTIYEEDVHVPLMLWFPRTYRLPVRSKVIGSHVDLAPTIADLAGLPAAPDWQGRNLFDSGHPPRAYFYVAEDHFTLGVRDGNWKYMFDLREGAEELYDLDRDPNEQHNLAATEPVLTATLRQRLAAWTEANRRQYGSTKEWTN